MNDALERVGDADVWTASRPLRFLALETGTRMTVVRLDDGGLFVHSPIALDDALRAAIDALGPVRAIVAPSKFHHLFVASWVAAYPEARVLACPGLPDKRPDVAWSGVLGDAPEPAWQGQLEQVLFAARSLENEVVFFHPESRSLVCVDAVFNLNTHPSGFTRFVARMIGNAEPGITMLERLLVRDKKAARAQVDRMLAWDFDRILLAHGAPVLTGGKDVLARAYAWL